MNRRQYIAAFSTGTVLGLSGCSSNSDSDEDSNDSDSTSNNNNNNADTPQSPQEESGDTPQNTEQVNSGPIFEPRIVLLDSVEVGDTYYVSVEVSNTGSEQGTWTGTIEGTGTRAPEPTDSTPWRERDIELEIPPGETRRWESEGSTVTEPAVYHYRFKNGNSEIQSVTVPTSREPIIETVNLVSDWESYGDAVDNEISSAQVGNSITIATRYWYWSENQSFEAFKQFEVYNESGERVGIDTSTAEQITQSSGWRSWESYSIFYTSDWDTGTHTASVTIRDEQNQEVSEVVNGEFTLY